MSELPPRVAAENQPAGRRRLAETAVRPAPDQAPRRGSGGAVAGILLAIGLTVIGLSYAFGEMMLSAMGVNLTPDLKGWIQGVLGVLAVGLLAAALTNANVRAVLRYTFLQCLRTRIVAAFSLLLAIVLAALPLMMKGDGTLAGQIRTFLIYSTAATALLLGLVTIFLSASLVSGDVRSKQIFLLEAKPLARWQYLVGRWMGLVLLNVVLMAVASGAIYGLALHLRGKKDLSETAGGPANQNDYRRVETEIFVARDKVAPQPLHVEQALHDRVEALRRENRFDQVLESYLEKAQGDRQLAERLLLDELQKQVSQERQSVPPGLALKWTFRGIQARDVSRGGQAMLTGVDSAARKLVLRAKPGLIAHVVHAGPIWVDGMEAQAGRTNREGFFEAVLSVDDWMKLQTRELKSGQAMEVTIEPLVQLKYKANAGGKLESGLVHGMWMFTNPQTGYAYYTFRRDAPAGEETITVPAKVVSADGRADVMFVNRSTSSISILHADLAMLYRTGGFEWNFLRAAAMILLGLAFLSALGLFSGSFVSFPVACLLCFCILPYAVGGSFLAQATRSDDSPVMMISHGAYRLMTVLLPDLTEALPTEHLVGGLRIGWAELGRVAVSTVVVRAMLVLALAWAIFRRRELARVQV